MNDPWESIAGYVQQKQQVNESMLMALKHGDLFDALLTKTRRAAVQNAHVPKALLLQGPPGTGKTTVVRLMAQGMGVPMVHIPTTKIFSKWFGQSERNLADILDACQVVHGTTPASGMYDEGRQP